MEVESVAEHWKGVEAAMDGGVQLEGNGVVRVVRLGNELSERVLRGAGHGVWRTSVEDVLVAGVARAVGGKGALGVTMEGHGRSGVWADQSRLDVSGTVGWFTRVWGVAVPLAGSVVEVKEALRAVKHVEGEGLGWSGGQ